ncbi:sugar nucleotide-binding protein [Eubacterium sp. AB3007]|uniref:SDR family oxidoreductase n=1 Tax=Eubacterium sp. AB3007 TaxID=1392487 RepID=UPI000488DF2C|nr:sugar nucleotide-binding protein [Eubacterium sp. AB3007]
MKFLVLGCNGMAGHLISLYLKERGHEVLGFALSKSMLVDSVVGDAQDATFMKELVGINKFDTVINCIGLLNKSCDEHQESAVYLNSYFPHQLAKLTEGTHTQVIHMSTDCVFSGKRGQYKENDFKDGMTFYDRTKALGEIENDKDLTMRQSIVGPDINQNGIGLMNWFMQQHGEVTGYTSAIWTGQTTLQLAKTMEAAAKERVYGLYNMVPDTTISKHDLISLFNKYLRNGKIKIIPVDKMAADKSLKRTRWAFNYKIPDYESMIAELADWMKEHKALYPHYNL